MEFLLTLGDSTGWHIIATPGTRLWVEKFATIMKLKPDIEARHKRWPRIFFSLKDSGRHGLAGDLPISGWRVHDLWFLRFWDHQACPDIICEIGDDGNYQLEMLRMQKALYIIYLQLQEKGGLPLHGALVERDGKGILLAGPGGSGKSTSCLRFPLPWRVLSDDQLLVVRDAGKNYLAHPLPTWSNYFLQRPKQEWNVQDHVRLAAIFFIEQAKSDEVLPIGQGRAAAFINYLTADVSCTTLWNMSGEEKRQLKSKIFDNSCELTKTIPVYMLRISLNGRFWEEMEKVL